MVEDLHISISANKKKRYETLLPQLRSLVAGESDLIANLANISAALKQTFNFHWVGFYLVKDKELVLGPFQGPIACTRIALGKGVCGTAWERKELILVDDVDAFPGHIACSSLSKSEIVVPVMKGPEVIMILDVDSERLSDFDETDAAYLKRVAAIIGELPG